LVSDGEVKLPITLIVRLVLDRITPVDTNRSDGEFEAYTDTDVTTHVRKGVVVGVGVNKTPVGKESSTDSRKNRKSHLRRSISK
jgi:hypothetical protein